MCRRSYVAAVCFLHSQTLDEFRPILCDTRPLGHQQIHDHGDRRAAVTQIDRAAELKRLQTFDVALVAGGIQFLDEVGVAVIGEFLRIEVEIDVERADVRGVGLGHQKRGHRAADHDHGIAMRAQHLAELQQNRMRGARTPIIVIDRDRRFAHEIVFQRDAMRSLSRCSAASAPRSPLTARSR